MCVCVSVCVCVCVSVCVCGACMQNQPQHPLKRASTVNTQSNGCISRRIAIPSVQRNLHLSIDIYYMSIYDSGDTLGTIAASGF